MARAAHFSEAELQQARNQRDHATTVAAFRNALAIMLRATLGLDAKMTAELLGTSRRTVFRSQSENRNQRSAIPKRSWGGRRRASLSLEEEREFLSEWEADAKDGGVLSVPPIHAALVERLGHDTPPSTTYRMLARHGWRKVQPDTKHPKSDPAVQDEFKKNSPKCWRPPA